MKGNIWQVAVVALACALVVPGLNVGLSDAATQKSADESLTVDYSSNSTVSADAAGYNDSVTITSNGTTLSEGTDYEWYPDSGEVEWLTSSTTDDGDDATVEYRYTTQTDTTTNIASMLSTVSPILGLLLFITAMGALLVISFDGWGGF